jgi:hypothetical protein
MNKKHVGFIVLMTVVAMLIWIIGEILIITVLNMGSKATITWSIIMIVLTIAVSMWRGLKDENKNNSRKW